MIGLGRMGEGMSAASLRKPEHEVHRYHNNYKNLKNNLKVVSMDIPLLWKGAVQYFCQKIDLKICGEKSTKISVYMPGDVFMMVVPAETVEDTLNKETIRFL